MPHPNPPRITGPVLKVLKELVNHPLEELSGAEIARSTGLASGTLYPILFRLEKSGWLLSHWEEVDLSEAKRPRKRLYRLTAQGESASLSVFREYLPTAGGLAWQS
jgi:DNA-binding PadR family transcriptional regulator